MLHGYLQTEPEIEQLHSEGVLSLVFNQIQHIFLQI